MLSNEAQVLVTGAGGFVGRHFCEYLLQQGYRVKAVGRNEQFFITHPKLQYYRIDNIDDQTPWERCLEDVQVIVHLAARVHHLKDRGMKALAFYQETNVKGTHGLVKAAIKKEVKRFIYISTIKVNGEKTFDMPFRAEDQPQPSDAYSLSKLQAEQLVKEESRRSGMEWVIIRPPLIYGPGVGGNFKRLFELAQKNIPLPLLWVRNRRSLVSIYNLCSFMESCVIHPHAGCEVFLVSDNEDLSTAQLIRTLKTVLNKGSGLFPFPVGFLKLAGSLMGKRNQINRIVDSLQVNIEKSIRLLNWHPPFSVESSLNAMVDKSSRVYPPSE